MREPDHTFHEAPPLLVAVLLVVGLLPAPGGAVTRMTAVLDRFEGDRAVLVTDTEDRLILPRSAVPPADTSTLCSG